MDGHLEQNWEATLEELVACSAILQDNFRCWAGDREVAEFTSAEADALREQGPSGKHLSCSAVIHLPLPDAGLTIQVKDGSTDGRGSPGGSGPIVRHLPPVTLRVAFPSGYPNDEPPAARLLAEWLAPAQAAALQLRLAAVWQEQGPGVPVVYAWVDWLETEALSSLGIADTLLLAPWEPHQQGGAPDSGRHDCNGCQAQAAAEPGSTAVNAPAPAPVPVSVPTEDEPELSGRPTQQRALDFVTGVTGDEGASSSSSDGEAEDERGPGRRQGRPWRGKVVGGPDALLMRLLAYSAFREAQLFRQGTHTCGVCLEEDLPGRHFVWPAPGCRHAFCRACIGRQAALHVAEGSLDALRCPDCAAPFSRQALASLLSAAELTRWEDLELAQSLQRMPDIVYCPRCSSACLEDGDNCAQCAKCFFAFCSLCNESWHPGVECMTAETRLKLLRARMSGAREGAAELRRRELEYLSLVRIQETSKRCPSCGMAIQKSEGCNKMTCSCGAFFCWRCQRQVDGYEHFRSSNCVLFEVADIQNWELDWNRQVERRANDNARNLFWRDVGAPGAACPFCGQQNSKAHHNNHMRCWACGAHFCYLCRQSLRGSKGASAMHFGKGKCPQHSPG